MPKFLIAFFVLLQIHAARANMASPVNEGTMSARMLTSKDVRILKESIHIKLDRFFKRADYRIEYHVRSNQKTNQIPLLFFAMDRNEKFQFRVWLDGKPVNLISDTIRSREELDERNKAFIKAYTNENYTSTTCVRVNWGSYSDRCIDLDDLKYFEAELTKGDHIIRVEYVGSVWEDRSDWVEKKSFRYSLSPARYWKSFGTLELTIDATDYPYPLKLKVGEHSQSVQSKQVHRNYSTLPGDCIIIENDPNISAFAKFLIHLGRGWLALIICILLIVIHTLQLYYWNNIDNNALRFGLFLLLTFVVSFIVCDSIHLAEQFIDKAIGPTASGFHGYSVILIFLIVLVWPIYAAVTYQLYKSRKHV